MRIDCPHCGNRSSAEFDYLGDASLLLRPDPSAFDALEQFHKYVYLRRNPAGEHQEIWQHNLGCREWLIVNRNTLDHRISGARFPSKDDVHNNTVGAQ